MSQTKSYKINGPKDKVTGKSVGSVSVPVAVGANLQETVQLYTEEVINHFIDNQVKIQLRSIVRPLLAQGLTNEVILTKMEGWKPEVKRRGRSTAEKVFGQFENLDPAERQKVMQAIRDLANAETAEA